MSVKNEQIAEMLQRMEKKLDELLERVAAIEGKR